MDGLIADENDGAESAAGIKGGDVALGRAAQEGAAPDAISGYDAIVREVRWRGGAVGPEFG